eukprot:14041206-Ditylum_brightwellii.AAC.1
MIKSSPEKNKHQQRRPIPNKVFTLVKGIVGVGISSLPDSISAFGDAYSGCLLIGILIVSTYSVALIGRVCAFTGTKHFHMIWTSTMDDKHHGYQP